LCNSFFFSDGGLYRNRFLCYILFVASQPRLKPIAAKPEARTAEELINMAAEKPPITIYLKFDIWIRRQYGLTMRGTPRMLPKLGRTMKFTCAADAWRFFRYLGEAIDRILNEIRATTQGDKK
jgi:hypothetical protein